MNLYHYHRIPESLHKYDFADTQLPAVFWDKYAFCDTDLKQRESGIATSANYSYIYARDNLFGRFEAGELAISKDYVLAYMYAAWVLKGEFELGEEVIATKAEYSYLYAKHALGRRFKRGEPIITKSAHYSYLYALYVMKGRFEAGEAAIATNAHFSKMYDMLLSVVAPGEEIVSIGANIVLKNSSNC